MAIPTNISFATAIDFGVATTGAVTQDVWDSGTALAYDVYYKLTTTAQTDFLWAFVHTSPLTFGYEPRVRVYSAAEVLLFSGDPNKAMQFAVTPSTTYYLKIEKDGNVDPSVFLLEFVSHVNRPLAAQSFFVPDDTDGLPAALLSTTTTNQTRRFTVYPAGEAQDVLYPSGVNMAEDLGAGNLKVFDKTFAQISSLAFTGAPRIRTNRSQRVFYVGSDTNPPVVRTVTEAGAFGPTTWTLTANTNLCGIAASNDGSVLYFSNRSTGSALKRWDLVNNVALSDLAAGETGRVTGDILVLDDDSIVCCFWGSVTDTYTLRRYSPDGTLLDSILGGSINSSASADARPRLAYDPQPGHFWFWTHPEFGVSLFQKIRTE